MKNQIITIEKSGKTFIFGKYKNVYFGKVGKYEVGLADLGKCWIHIWENDIKIKDIPFDNFDLTITGLNHMIDLYIQSIQ